MNHVRKQMERRGKYTEGGGDSQLLRNRKRLDLSSCVWPAQTFQLLSPNGHFISVRYSHNNTSTPIFFQEVSFYSHTPSIVTLPLNGHTNYPELRQKPSTCTLTTVKSGPHVDRNCCKRQETRRRNGRIKRS